MRFDTFVATLPRGRELLSTRRLASSSLVVRRLDRDDVRGRRRRGRCAKIRPVLRRAVILTARFHLRAATTPRQTPVQICAHARESQIRSAESRLRGAAAHPSRPRVDGWTRDACER